MASSTRVLAHLSRSSLRSSPRALFSSELSLRSFSSSQTWRNQQQPPQEQPEIADESVQEPVAGEEGSQVLDAATLKKQLDEAIKDREQFRDQLMRSLAEMENTRKIAKRDVDNAVHYGIESFAKSLLPVNDNLVRALESIQVEELSKPENRLLKDLYDGVSMTKDLMAKALRSQHIEEFNPLNEKFDPNRHDALFMIPHSGNMTPSTVGQVINTGYAIRSRVLRAAKVGVISQPANAN